MYIEQQRWRILHNHRIPVPDQMITGPEDPRTTGSLDQGIPGPQDSRTTGFQDHRIPGPQDSRTTGFQDHRIPGPLNPRATLPYACLHTEHRTITSLIPKPAGPWDHRQHT
jgi:hypothetical protein